MKKQSCPHIGMQEDPTTALDFPSEGNFCHRAEPTAPVNKIHQQRYCLTAGHYGCPVYRDARPGGMPAALLPPAERRVQAVRVTKQLSAFVLPLVVFGIAALGLILWIVAPQILGIDNALIPSTGEETPNGDTSFNLFSFGDTRDTTLTPFFPQFGGSSGQMSVPNCPQPAGWMPYITNPTDSLFRLSVVYGVPVEELQKVNCKDESDTVILPGQVIYVPAVSQGTAPSSVLGQQPTAFPTFTPASIVRVPQGTPSSSGDNDNNPVPPAAPTSTVRVPTSTVRIPPTITARPSLTSTLPVIPTVAPPTSTLVPATPTLVPPTQKPTNPPQPTRTRRPTATDRPPATATKPPPPTATNPPPPTATNRPPATATNPPPPTATNPPPPTATNRPPTATNPPPPTATTPPPATNTPEPPPPTDPPPTDPPPTDPPPTDPPPTEPPPEPTATDPPLDITEPPPVETEPPPGVTAPPPEETELPPEVTEPPPVEYATKDPRLTGVAVPF